MDLKKKKEVSKDIKSWDNFISSPKESLNEEITQKDKEKARNALKTSVMFPMCVVMRHMGVQNRAEKH